MRNLLVALVLLASAPVLADAPSPPISQAAPSGDRKPSAPTSSPAPRPAPRPSSSAPSSPPKSSYDAPRSESSSHRPLAEPFEPTSPTRRQSAPPTSQPPIYTPSPGTYDTPRGDPPTPPKGEAPRGSESYAPQGETLRGSEPYEPKVARPAFEGALGEPSKRAWDGAAPVDRAPRAVDHRMDRPPAQDVHRHPDAHHPPPSPYYYHSCYASWWVHPYYRWMYPTWLIVYMPYPAYPWDAMWVPAYRTGWMWVPGAWYGPYWYAGYWEPVAPAPYYYGSPYVYVPGFWYGDLYYEGYWRVADRRGFVWVDPWYRDSGEPERGHWRPTESIDQDGYVWEAGFWNGEDWVEGFWRPESRVGYRWVSAAFDADGFFHAGYWEPIELRPGHVWIPGWFDGVEWVPGYWVTDDEYRSAHPESWEPPETWDAGSTTNSAASRGDEPRLAIPVE